MKEQKKEEIKEENERKRSVNRIVGALREN